MNPRGVSQDLLLCLLPLYYLITTEADRGSADIADVYIRLSFSWSWSSNSTHADRSNLFDPDDDRSAFIPEISTLGDQKQEPCPLLPCWAGNGSAIWGTGGVFTWTWPWGSVLRCSLWCGCCSRRKGLQTQSDLQGCPQPPSSPRPLCRPQTAADTTSRLDPACSPRYTWNKRGQGITLQSLYRSWM